jgi:predicted phosphohydrolase
MKQEINIVAFSDTHGEHRELDVPDGDVLLCAGDIMTCGRKFNEVMDFADWFMKFPHLHKVFIAGNHDRLFESKLALCLNEFTQRQNGSTFHYLEDCGVTIKGWNFWGSPVQPWFYDWAFNRYRGPDIQKHWDKIPADTDFLITHGPPYGIGDQAIPYPMKSSWSSDFIVQPSEHCGCEQLLKKVREVNPELHVFGHIHGGCGMYPATINDQPDFKPGYKTCFANVSICDEQYNPTRTCHSFWFAERE